MQSDRPGEFGKRMEFQFILTGILISTIQNYCNKGMGFF